MISFNVSLGSIIYIAVENGWRYQNIECAWTVSAECVLNSWDRLSLVNLWIMITNLASHRSRKTPFSQKRLKNHTFISSRLSSTALSRYHPLFRTPVCSSYSGFRLDSYWTVPEWPDICFWRQTCSFSTSFHRSYSMRDTSSTPRPFSTTSELFCYTPS